jgi:hypothetical protein
MTCMPTLGVGWCARHVAGAVTNQLVLLLDLCVQGFLGEYTDIRARMHALFIGMCVCSGAGAVAVADQLLVVLAFCLCRAFWVSTQTSVQGCTRWAV